MIKYTLDTKTFIDLFVEQLITKLTAELEEAKKADQLSQINDS